MASSSNTLRTIAMPAGMGIILYAGQIISLLFPSSPEAVNIAAPLLSSLGASVLLSWLVTTSCAVLQSYGRNASDNRTRSGSRGKGCQRLYSYRNAGYRVAWCAYKYLAL